MMNIYLTLILVAAIHSGLMAQTLPSHRISDWQEAGYPGPLPDYATILDVTNYGALGDGTTDDYPTIMSALAAAGGQPTIIYFPAGDYLVKDKIVLPDSCIIKGAGSQTTRILFHMDNHSKHCFEISSLQDTNFTPLNSGFLKGANTLEPQSLSGFSSGDYLELRQENGSWDTNPAAWAEKCVGQMLKVEAIIGNNLILDQPLRLDFSSSLNPEIRKVTPRLGVGFEDFYIQRLDTPSVDVGYNFNFSFAANCWMTGVESNTSSGTHVMLKYCRNVEITGNYIHHAFEYTGVGTKGYGVTMRQHTGSCLVEKGVSNKVKPT